MVKDNIKYANDPYYLNNFTTFIPKQKRPQMNQIIWEIIINWMVNPSQGQSNLNNEF